MRRISTRLAVSFLIVALLPALPLSWVVNDLLERRFGPAITVPLESALESGLDESRAHLRELKSQLRLRITDIAADESMVPGLSLTAPDGSSLQVVLLDVLGRTQPADSLNTLLVQHPEVLGRATALVLPTSASITGPSRLEDLLVAAAPWVDEPRRGLLVLQQLPTGMVQRARSLSDGLSLLRAVDSEQSRVLLSFVAPFLIIYGVLLLVALIAGHLWTRSMVRPLETLVQATERVREGDFEFRLEKGGPGEVGDLVEAFDAMVSGLAEQRRDLARLERAAAWRGMARTLAHEVKNPLTPILLAVQEAADSYKGDDETYRALLGECVVIVREEVESLRRLVREFGDFARLPKPTPCENDLVEMLRDLEQLYGPDRLHVECSATHLRGWFDFDALRRALVNLIDNGLAACAEQGNAETVTLTLQRCEQGACLEVRDRGTGIAARNIDNIFKPDFTTKRNGMGLGLAIVESIVVGHGGRISVRSEPGAGAEFRLELPLTPLEQKALPAPEPGSGQTEDGNS